MLTRSKDYRPFLDDIRRSCERVMHYTDGLTEEQFLADEKTYDATLRHLIVIGEAVKQIPEEVREQHPAVEWKQIARFRDHVIHRDFSINNDIIWDVVANKVPELLVALASEESAET